MNVIGNSDEITSNFNKKKYKSEAERVEQHRKRSFVISIIGKREIYPLVFKKHNTEYCYYCLESNWNEAQIQCAECKYFVHVDCDEEDPEHDINYYITNNINYYCFLCKILRGHEPYEEVTNDLYQFTSDLFMDFGHENGFELVETSYVQSVAAMISYICKSIDLIISAIKYKMKHEGCQGKC